MVEGRGERAEGREASWQLTPRGPYIRHKVLVGKRLCDLAMSKALEEIEYVS